MTFFALGTFFVSVFVVLVLLVGSSSPDPGKNK
jgi:hypothetical protein